MSMGSVALAPNGDCWAAGSISRSDRGIPALAYFAHCRGRGVLTTGFQNPSVGTVDIDDNGNLVVLSPPFSSTRSVGELYIYSGCNPTCSLVGGPFQLQNFIVYGHLDASSKKFVGAVYDGDLDVYSYSTSGVNYEYSITRGFYQGYGPLSAAFSPSSKE